MTNIPYNELFSRALTFSVLFRYMMREVKMGMGMEGSEIPGGWESVEIAWPLVCR